MSDLGERVGGAIERHRASVESKRSDAIALASERDERASAAAESHGGEVTAAALAPNGGAN